MAFGIWWFKEGFCVLTCVLKVVSHTSCYSLFCWSALGGSSCVGIWPLPRPRFWNQNGSRKHASNDVCELSADTVCRTDLGTVLVLISGLYGVAKHWFLVCQSLAPFLVLLLVLFRWPSRGAVAARRRWRRCLWAPQPTGGTWLGRESS